MATNTTTQSTGKSERKGIEAAYKLATGILNPDKPQAHNLAPAMRTGDDKKTKYAKLHDYSTMAHSSIYKRMDPSDAKTAEIYRDLANRGYGKSREAGFYSASVGVYSENILDVFNFYFTKLINTAPYYDALIIAYVMTNLYNKTRVGWDQVKDQVYLSGAKLMQTPEANGQMWSIPLSFNHFNTWYQVRKNQAKLDLENILQQSIDFNGGNFPQELKAFASSFEQHVKKTTDRSAANHISAAEAISSFFVDSDYEHSFADNLRKKIYSDNSGYYNATEDAFTVKLIKDIFAGEKIKVESTPMYITPEALSTILVQLGLRAKKEPKLEGGRRTGTRTKKYVSPQKGIEAFIASIIRDYKSFNSFFVPNKGQYRLVNIDDFATAKGLSGNYSGIKTSHGPNVGPGRGVITPWTQEQYDEAKSKDLRSLQTAAIDFIVNRLELTKKYDSQKAEGRTPEQQYEYVIGLLNDYSREKGLGRNYTRPRGNDHFSATSPGLAPGFLRAPPSPSVSQVPNPVSGSGHLVTPNPVQQHQQQHNQAHTHIPVPVQHIPAPTHIPVPVQHIPAPTQSQESTQHHTSAPTQSQESTQHHKQDYDYYEDI